MHAPIWRVILDTAKSGLADPTVRNSAILRAPLLEQKKEAQKVLADLGQPCA